MDEVATCRLAARDAVRDVEPDGLRRVIDDVLAEATFTPGVLTLRVARAAAAVDGDAAVAVSESPDAEAPRNGATDDAFPDHVTERAAGVQLIYEGLRLIRRLASENPWSLSGDTDLVDGDADDADHTEENLAVLAADVLVSRGFYLLARTPAADRAVQTVRNFGRDQTLAMDDGRTDHSLEADVLRLALVAGTAVIDGVAPAGTALSTVADLGRGGSLPPAETVLDEVAVEAVPVGGDLAPGSTPSATDP